MQKLIFLRIGLVLNLLEDASLLAPLRHNGAKILEESSSIYTLHVNTKSSPIYHKNDRKVLAYNSP